MSQSVFLDKLSIQAVTVASGVYCGRNIEYNVKSISKQNHGYGVVSGEYNMIPAAVNTVNDPDIWDSYVDIKQDNEELNQN